MGEPVRAESKNQPRQESRFFVANQVSNQQVCPIGGQQERKNYDNVINRREPEKQLQGQDLFSLSLSSLTNLWDYTNAFSPWIGTCPVLNYSLQKNLIPKISATPLYTIYNFQLGYLFNKMSEDKENEKIFLDWTN